jgi:hypothetical protein
MVSVAQRKVKLVPAIPMEEIVLPNAARHASSETT